MYKLIPYADETTFSFVKKNIIISPINPEFWGKETSIYLGGSVEIPVSPTESLVKDIHSYFKFFKIEKTSLLKIPKDIMELVAFP